MAELERLKNALRKADAAGNTEDARRIAKAIRNAQNTAGPTRGAAAALPKPRTVMDRVQGALGTINEGLSFGYADEGAAAIEAVLGDPKSGKFFDYSRPFGERYKSGREQERAEREAFSEENPVLAPAMEIGGALVPAGALAKGGLTLMGRAGSTAGKVAAGAGEGALYGGVYGSGKAEPGQRLEGAAFGAGAGAAAGGALSFAGQKVGNALARRAGVKAAPSNTNLREGAKAAYETARAQGVTYGPAQYDKFIAGLSREMSEQGIDKTIHPKATAALGRLDELRGAAPTLENLETLRRVSASAAKSIDPDERRIASMIIERVDDFAADAGNVASATGSAKVAAEKLGEGRDLWGKLRRSEMVDEALLKAERRAASTGSGGNTENAMRQNIRGILDSAKKRRGFSAAEIEAMEKFVRGGPAQNFARLVGKLSPKGNGLMAALGIGATAMNPLMATFPAAGMVAKGLAERGTRKGADLVSALTRSGGNLPGPSAAPRVTAAQRNALVRALSGYGGGLTGSAVTGQGR